MTYARTTSPFNFLGTLTESQRDALQAWVNSRLKDSEDIAMFHRVRAHQLRKSAGLLEEFYRRDSRGLVPTFQKDPWQPGNGGHFAPNPAFDSPPADAVATIKGTVEDQLASDDEAVFRMNFVRTRIEAHEDMAQEALDAPGVVKDSVQKLTGFFNDPAYEGACIRDKADTFDGEPRYRQHPLDPPTAWERKLRLP